jgi:ribosomal protein L1
MNEDTMNMEIRKFLKNVGINSQRNIEQAVQKALADGRLQGNETLSVKMTLELADLSINDSIEGQIRLE